MQANPNTTLSSILHLDVSDSPNVASQLNDTGVLGVAEAYISGWTMQDIAKALRGSQVAVLQWENALKEEDKALLRQAKTANLEQLESHLTKLMQAELESQSTDDDEMKAANLVDKRLQSIQRVLSATQQQLERYQRAAERGKSSGGDVHITQMIVSNEWLAALPDE
jgi:transcriptional regulator with XRE-family HTH domain